MRGREGVVAAVDANDAGVIVWWTNVGVKPHPKMSRLVGAWMLEPADTATLESVTFQCISLATSAGRGALAAAGIEPERVLDVSATVAAMNDSRRRCQEAFYAEQASRPASKRLVEPTWPSFGGPIDVERPPPWDVNDSARDYLDSALSVSHWLAALCTRWEDFEEERLGRPLLRNLEGDDERCLPFRFVGEA